MFLLIFRRPYRFFLYAAVLAVIMCLLPIPAQDAPKEKEQMAKAAPETEVSGVPAGADLSERTQAGCMLHETLVYAPCGHSVQRREAMNPRLVGLSREAFENEIEQVIPSAVVTGFSAVEVDVSRSMDVPCPLHWVLKVGEDGMLQVWQNRTGDALSFVRGTEVPMSGVGEGEKQELLDGRVFDDVQAMEGYLESMSS